MVFYLGSIILIRRCALWCVWRLLGRRRKVFLRYLCRVVFDVRCWWCSGWCRLLEIAVALVVGGYCDIVRFIILIIGKMVGELIR